MRWIVTWLLSVQAGQSLGWILYAMRFQYQSTYILCLAHSMNNRKNTHSSEKKLISLGMPHFRRSLNLRKCRRRCIGGRINGQRTFQDSARHKRHKSSFPVETLKFDLNIFNIFNHYYMLFVNLETFLVLKIDT